MDVVCIIPARYHSSRLPGKPLMLFGGKPLIQHTYENASRCAGFKKIFVASDDDRIIDVVHSFGGKALLTSATCPTGTDRVIDALKRYPEAIGAADIVINIQGDEPLLAPSIIDALVTTLLEDPSADVATAITPLWGCEEVSSPSAVKCVVDKRGYALYFSRSVIPASKSGGWSAQHTYYKHIGVYSYRHDKLLEYASMTSTPLQCAEDLEQLKILEWGGSIRCAVVDSSNIGIDTVADAEKFELQLCKQSIYS